MSKLHLINVFYRLPISLTDILNRDSFVTYSKLGPPLKKKKKTVDVYLVNQVKKDPLCMRIYKVTQSYSQQTLLKTFKTNLLQKIHRNSIDYKTAGSFLFLYLPY